MESELSELPTMTLEPWMEILKQFGIAGLFIAMYLTTIWYFYKELKESKKEMRETVERTTLALEKSDRIGEDTIRLLRSLEDTMTDNSKQISEFISFQRGRDSGGYRQ